MATDPSDPVWEISLLERVNSPLRSELSTAGQVNGESLVFTFKFLLHYLPIKYLHIITQPYGTKLYKLSVTIGYGFFVL